MVADEDVGCRTKHEYFLARNKRENENFTKKRKVPAGGGRKEGRQKKEGGGPKKVKTGSSKHRSEKIVIAAPAVRVPYNQSHPH